MTFEPSPQLPIARKALVASLFLALAAATPVAAENRQHPGSTSNQLVVATRCQPASDLESPMLSSSRSPNGRRDACASCCRRVRTTRAAVSSDISC